MIKRLLDTTAAQFEKYTKDEKLESIGACEGRVIASETIGIFTPLLGDISNVELVSSMGADILLLNIFDVNEPVVKGIPCDSPSEIIRTIKKLTGKMVAINLEPVPDGWYDNKDESIFTWKISKGRLALPENAIKAADMGVDMILITGNPGNGVSNAGILKALKEFKEVVGDRVILATGKMHAASILSEGGENIITEADVDAFIENGADIVLLPAPGTVPGITMEYARSIIARIHSKNKLAMTAIGTSQEGTDKDTIKSIALMCKMAGADIHHIGDSGFTGIAAPENILTYSIVIRGMRHAYRRMAMSINR